MIKSKLFLSLAVLSFLNISLQASSTLPAMPPINMSNYATFANTVGGVMSPILQIFNSIRYYAGINHDINYCTSIVNYFQTIIEFLVRGRFLNLANIPNNQNNYILYFMQISILSMLLELNLNTNDAMNEIYSNKILAVNASSLNKNNLPIVNQLNQTLKQGQYDANFTPVVNDCFNLLNSINALYIF